MTVPSIEEVLVLGAGYAGAAVLARARDAGLGARGVVRSPARAEELRARGFEVVVAPVFGAELGSLAGARTHVVVTFPPDGEVDARVAAGLGGVGAITYLSSTGVYGDRRGPIDDTTPTTERPSASAARRLDAEAIWRDRGATILRCPAIYGPDRGLHVRVWSGKHRLPGDGSGFVSRVHVEDLAAFVLAAPRAAGETFVVGDAEPAPQREVVAWLHERYGAPIPPSVPLEEVHETLRGDRRIDPRRALARLGVTLRYPSYEVGYVLPPPGG